MTAAESFDVDLHGAGLFGAVWSFASVSLLAWAAAAAIPLVIHLWSRRRYQEQSWAAMSFLMAALRRHARRLWMEQWLLLVLRMSLLVLLAIALADPVRENELDASLTDVDAPATHWIFVADVSYSMDYRRNERSLLDSLRDRFTTLVRDARQGDGFSLVLLAEPPQTVIGEPTFDASAVLEELQSLRTSHAGGDLRATLGEVERIVGESSRHTGRLGRRRVIVGTDLGRATWKASQEPDVAEAWTRIAESASLTLVDVGVDDASNLALTLLSPRDSLATVGRDVRIDAVVRNFGDRDVTAVPVEFSTSLRSLGVQTIDVPAGGQATASATVQFPTAGDHLVTASLRPDSLPIDNRRWLSVPVRERRRVLCIEGRLDEARFLALALDPVGGASSPVAVELASEATLLDRPLRGFDLVCLCNVARVTHAEGEALRRYVAQGGQLAVFLGDQTQPTAYNDELARDVESTVDVKRLLPARLSPPVTRETQPLNPFDYRDALVAPFRGQERTGFLSTPVWTYVPAQVIDANAAQVAVAFADGSPWIVHERRGAGRVWLFTTDVSGKSLDRQASPPQPWSAWSTWPSFVPLVQQLLRVSLSDRQRLHNVLIGEPASGVFPRANVPEELTWSRLEPTPGVVTTAVRLATQPAEEGIAWSMTETLEAGPFSIRGGMGNDEQLVAVNLDTRESDLERWDPTLLPEALRRDVREAADGPDQRSAPTSGRHWFRTVLACLLGLLLSESLLAWWLGWRAGRRTASLVGGGTPGGSR